MKRLLCAVAMVFVVLGPYVYADGIPSISTTITYVTVSMGPNDGSGDNASFTMIGPGTEITGVAGMGCWSWCAGDFTNNPVELSQLFIGPFTSATVNGVSYDPDSEFSLFCCAFNGADLNSSVSGQVGSGDTYAQLQLMLPSGGNWNLTFIDGGAEGEAFVHGTFTAGTPPSPVPEPGMIGMMATGLAGIIGVIRRNRLICRSGTN